MKPIEDILSASLTPHEARWADELANKLPDDVDLTFEECKILTRVDIDEWPAELLLKVKDAIDSDDLMNQAEDKNVD
ncbi:MAG TPA: hypothetical protein VGJ93_02465 [Desulfuromonadaceae bacterium]|jgi:hypothetical protein